jgi:hypothetical protein
MDDGIDEPIDAPRSRQLLDDVDGEPESEDTPPEPRSNRKELPSMRLLQMFGCVALLNLHENGTPNTELFIARIL